MVIKAFVIAAAFAGLEQASLASGQSVTAEADLTAGYSTEEVSAAASQARLFGDAGAGIEYFVEASWGARSTDGTDVFGVAYPYTGRLQVIEVYAERLFQPGGTLLSIRAGRFRTPFGMYNRSDHGYSGFVRAPLVRYDGYFALSNNYLEHGAAVMFGVPRLSVEASIGRPHDIGTVQRRAGIDTALRLQGYSGPFIVGVSHSRSNPYMPARFAHGRAIFTGVDWRVTFSGLQLRGEWIAGQSFDGAPTRGWYADGIFHHRVMGPLTLVARAESLDYDPAPPHNRYARRYVAGGRLRLPGPVTAQVNLTRQAGQLPHRRNTSADISLTYSLRRTLLSW